MARHGWRPFRAAALATVACCLGTAVSQTAQAQFPTADAPAGYLVFPKVVVDIGGTGVKTDTLIQLTNVSTVGPRYVHCVYVDGATWEPINANVILTAKQPTAWRASEGLNITDPSQPGSGTLVPPVGGRTPFVGELKCFQVNDPQTPVPVAAQDIKGEATIIRVSAGAEGIVDASAYNAIGFQPITVSQTEPPAAFPQKCQGGTNPGVVCSDDSACTGNGKCGATLCLGATANSAECATATHVGCPNTLILNNFFDFATDPVTDSPIRTVVTFVPCSEDLTKSGSDQPSTMLQFLVFNEFEQRLSSATRVQCYRETLLSHIDMREGYEQGSVFNVAVQGTLAGQIRIRPVLGPSTETSVGHGVLAIAEEFHGDHAAAFNLNDQGRNSSKGDFVRYLP